MCVSGLLIQIHSNKLQMCVSKIFRNVKGEAVTGASVSRLNPDVTSTKCLNAVMTDTLIGPSSSSGKWSNLFVSTPK